MEAATKTLQIKSSLVINIALQNSDQLTLAKLFTAAELESEVVEYYRSASNASTVGNVDSTTLFGFHCDRDNGCAVGVRLRSRVGGEEDITWCYESTANR